MKNIEKKIKLLAFIVFVFCLQLIKAQVYTNSLTTTVCPSKAVDGTAPGWTTISNMTLTETAKNDFRKSKTGTIILSAPTGWYFNTAVVPTLSGVSADFISMTIAMTNSTTITISFQTFTITPAVFDVITISGLQVQALSMLSAAGPIYCSGTTGFVPIGLISGVQGTGFTFANLNQYPYSNAGSNQVICANNTVMLANNPAPGTGAWTVLSGAATITSPTLYNTTVTGLAVGTATLQWADSNCGGTTSQVTITRTTTPVSVAGPDQTMCFPNTTSLAANFPPFGTGTWSILAGSANTSTTQISDLNDESAVFTPAAVGTYTLQWTISLAGCTSSTNDMIVTVTAGPNLSVAGASQTVCIGSTATMAANSPTTGATAVWSVVSGPSTLLSQFSSSSSPTAVFTPAGGAGTYILSWSITRVGCTSTSTTSVVVKSPPTVATAGTDQTVCTTATLAANTPAVGTGSWTVISGGGTFSSTTDPNSTYAPTTLNLANTIRWTISNAPCAASFDDVVITATCIPTTTLSIPSNSTTTVVGLTGCPSTKILYDNGGPSGDYAADALGTVTFTAPAGSCLSYSFTSFQTESGYDFLTVINGAVGSPTIGTYAGSTVPPSGVTTSNTLTVRFDADNIVQYPGFAMSVSCANACIAGSISGGAAVATPTLRCSSYTTSLSLTGGSTADCSITYQWQSSTTSSVSGFSNMTGSTAKTATANVSTLTYYRCILSCGGSTVASAAVTASLQPGGCGCPQSITLPYTSTGQTTCGQGNDITSSNVNTVNGSSSYYTGEDVIYTFTASATGQITVDLTSSGSYTGLMLYRNCPTAAGTATVANAQDSYGNKTLCASVTAGQVYYLIIDSWASPTCNPYDLTISAPTGTAVACNMAYTAATTTYSFESFSGTALPTTDDVLFNVAINFGFPVCFDGVPFTGGYVASNAALVFDAVQCFPNVQSGTIASGGVSTGYTIPSPAPVNGTSIPRNAVLAPWHDIHPGLGGTIQYTTLGTAPNRRFIVSFENIPMYSCGTSSPTIYHSSQIKVFETTNTIELHVRKKAVCPGWNNGQAVLGLHNYNGTVYIPPVSATAHNAKATSPYNQWTMATTAYKFTTSCGSAGACAIVLPIGLVNFYGERVNKINHLYWETSSEENIKTYSIERSTDGINFIEIGVLTAKNLPSKYHFEDHYSVPGIINYYRVIVKENNGTESSTNIISLSSGNDEVITVSRLFPNPASNSFMIGLDSKQKGEATINVYDVFGKIMSSSDYEVNGGVNQYSISLDGFTQGVYYVEVLNSFNEIITKQKLVKE
ncbi:MAG: choice-of-anchor domain [Bacteroidetes bacterium]|jgi:hypothetical protein|nr:choice-of-anchor domain [Bacteroidota bacterium]MDF2453687.1 choice-of-anchor domain [Bacteroidota bacterium]